MTDNPRDPFQPAPADPGRGAFATMDGAPASAPTPVGPVAARPRRSGSGMLVNVLLGIALVVAVGGVAFAAGRATAPASAAAAGRTGFGQGGAGGQGFGGPGASGAPGRGFGFGGGAGSISIQGTVEAIDGSSMTIKLPSGQTVTIGLNGSTTYHSQTAATASDVTSGSSVIVQLQGRGGAGGGQPRASGAPAPSGAPAVGLGTAGSVTVVPTGS